MSQMTISTTILQTAVSHQIPFDLTEEAHANNVKMSKQKKIQFNSYVYIRHSLVDVETFHLRSAATGDCRGIFAT